MAELQVFLSHFQPTTVAWFYCLCFYVGRFHRPARWPGWASGRSLGSYRWPWPVALALFHRALARAASLALPAGLILRVGAATIGLGWEALALAHLALAAAAILALPAALMTRFGAAAGSTGAGIAGAGTGALAGAEPPRSCSSSVWSASILSWISAALRSC